MYAVVFVTVAEEDANLERATGPLLFVEDCPGSSLPPHPRAMYWRYAATVPLADHLFQAERSDIEIAFADGQPYISQRLLLGKGITAAAQVDSSSDVIALKPS